MTISELLAISKLPLILFHLTVMFSSLSIVKEKIVSFVKTEKVKSNFESTVVVLMTLVCLITP